MTTPGGPDDRVSKSSLSFILDDYINESSAASSIFSDSDYEAPPSSAYHQFKSAGGLTSAATATAAATRSGKAGSKMLDAPRRRGKQQGDPKRKARRPPSRICKHEGCEQYVVDQGLCVRHGGGKRCQTEGCTSRAKHQGRCWRHGGSTECKVSSCINRAKSRGYCWSHGGGTKCKADSCEKIAISNGLCWAHGGGKRCIVKGCMRQAYERTNNYCNNHFQELHGDAAAASASVDDEMTEEEKESDKTER
uniref:WRKY19-like zinc finger domain-containing protein n=1 Tax=Globisporangium ultimum (strain ATCC 200006 / CBS 805.95 / DAOM BR144) TaxID=431595 RepID=K3WFA5_GLOUD